MLYENVRTTILSLDPLPTINRAYHMVLQIEKQKEITCSNVQDSMGMQEDILEQQIKFL